MNNNKNNNKKAKATFHLLDLTSTELLMEGFWDRTTTKATTSSSTTTNKSNNNNKYISAIADPILTKL